MSKRKKFPRIMGQSSGGNTLYVEVNKTMGRIIINADRSQPIIFPPTPIQTIVKMGEPWYDYTGPPELLDEIFENGIEVDEKGIRIANQNLNNP